MSFPVLTFSQYRPSLNRLHNSSDVTRWMKGAGLSAMITVDAISAMLQQLAQSNISLDQFDEWLTRDSWNMHKDSSPAAVKMVGEIERRMAECDSGVVAEEELLLELEKMAGFFHMGQRSNLRVVASADVNPLPFSFQLALLAGADKRFATEFSYTPLQPVAR